MADSKAESKSVSWADIKTMLDKGMRFLQWLVGIALMLIFVATVADHLGFSQRLVPIMPELKLLILAGAWALMTGRLKIG